MKIIFTLTVFVVFSLMASPAQSSSVTNNPADKGEKNKSITIGSNRASGDMLVRFTAEKAGTVSIEVLNESGKVVLQQTNKITNSINAIPLKRLGKPEEIAAMVNFLAGAEADYITGSNFSVDGGITA